MNIELSQEEAFELAKLAKFLKKPPDQIVLESLKDTMANAYTVSFPINLSEYEAAIKKTNDLERTAKNLFLEWANE